ncbi:diptericin [Ceratitis capitata]|nr:diptericin [Ceratitis capitata]
MLAKILILFCLIHISFALPKEYQPQNSGFFNDEDALFANLQRSKRQFNLQGGGSPGKGLDLSLNARVPVWQSGNARHSFDATGQYAQHLGGPYGNSPPQWGVGGIYTYRF